MTTRQTIYNQIETERQCQDALWGGETHDDAHPACGWVALLVRHVGLAVDDGTADADERFRRQMVRVAALAVAAIEAHDRRHGDQSALVYASGPGY
jgi:hypothetical protein